MHTVVGHGVQRRTTTPAIPRPRGYKLWPFSTCSWVSFRYHIANSPLWRQEVPDRQREVPDEEIQPLKKFLDGRYEEHGGKEVEDTTNASCWA